MSDFSDDRPWEKYSGKKSNLSKHEQVKLESQEARAEADAGHPDPDVYYREMSVSEYDAMTKDSRINVTVSLTWKNTKNYRYWLSTSLVKVKQFKNENATDGNDRIVQLTFKKGFSEALKKILAPHQMRDVQHNDRVVAYHREGFLEHGNVDTMEEMANRLKADTHYNVGFTLAQAELLQKNVARADVL